MGFVINKQTKKHYSKFVLYWIFVRVRLQVVAITNEKLRKHSSSKHYLSLFFSMFLGYFLYRHSFSCWMDFLFVISM